MLNWGCLGINVFTGCTTGLIYANELDLPTHKYEKYWVASAAFMVDFLAKIISIVCATLLYSEYSIILTLFALTVTKINLYAMVKVHKLHRPDIDLLLIWAQVKIHF